MFTKSMIFTLLFFLGILPGCAPLKLNTCTEVPQIVDKVESLASYAGRDVCASLNVQFTMPEK